MSNFLTRLCTLLLFSTLTPIEPGYADVFITKLTVTYSISGHVFDEASAPVNGAEVVLNDSGSITAIVTGADGSYEFSNLREGGSFTVSAAKPHFTMTPASQNFTNLSSNQTLNFTATSTDAPFFTISGQVTHNTIGLPGVTMTLTGSQFGIRTTDSNGGYSFEVPGGGDYTVTPSATGFAFDPPGLAVNNLSTSRIGNFAVSSQSFVVTNAADHGSGSFREAIIHANAKSGTDTIIFNIPGLGVKVFNLLTPLPEITDPVVIDASTQPGYAGTPLIELDGTNAGPDANGLVITTGHTIVRGLAIGHFQAAGLLLRSGDFNGIQGNYIGVDATGTLARPNNVGIQISNSSNNLIGGNSAGAGNLISGNGSGIFIQAPLNTVQGNLIGTDITGTRKIGNGTGIHAQAPSTVIGGLTPEARNVISGNGKGVVFGEPLSKLQGNFIGTDITGTVALGNTFEGVVVSNGASIGGTVPEARNVISGNGVSNISMGSWFIDGLFIHFTTVEGNYIGTDVTGNQALTDPALSTTNSGIFIFGSLHVIGGNVISGNAVGIRMRMTNLGPPSRNTIHGNLIGLNAAGTGPVPNTQGGIELSQARDNRIGGTSNIAANKIAFNGGPGVRLSSGNLNNLIGHNSIFSNDGLGIDLGQTGVTPNDPTDADVGDNNLQNFPVITSVLSVGDSTTIQGNLNSTPNTTFQIEFFSSAALDPSGHGEGALFLGTTPVTTDGNGNAAINVTFPAAVGTGRVVTATATDPEGNTSEFSAGDIASAAGNVQFSVDSISVIEDVGLATITVLRKGGSTGTLTVDYSTIEGTATAGQDYTTTSGTLTFNGGETSKSFQIPITDDAVTEADETFTVVLRNGSSLESLGTPNTLVVTIQDRTTVLELLLDESGPAIDQAAALDALLLVRDPFRVVGIPDWFTTESDRNTRVMFFVRGLQLNPGESSSSVIVQLGMSDSQIFDVPAEDVRLVPNSEFTQVVIRLPNNLSVGACTVMIRVHSRTSNIGTIRIAP